MKISALVLLLGVIAQPVFASQNWLCEGRGNDGHAYKIIFEARSNTEIAQILVTEDDLILSRINPRVSRDQKYRPTTYKNYNRYDISSGRNSLKLLLPKNLGRLEDEFPGYVQIGIGKSSAADTVKLTCSGAG